MKNSIIILSFFISLPSAYAKCNTEAIGIYREKGFGLSFGGGNSQMGYTDKNTTNVPLSINGRAACFKKRNAFRIKSEKKKGKSEKNSLVITPMKTEFENVPTPHQKQYIFVEKHDNPLLTKFHLMSFICSGEIPLSIEATSDSVLKLQSNSVNSGTVTTSHVFAAGPAAKNWNKITQVNSTFSEAFDFFTKLYKEESKKEIEANKICCTDYHIPSIISDTSIRSLSEVERTIASQFTSMAADVPNGCSKDFSESMKRYQLQNFESNESLRDYSVKKKGGKFVFEWK